MDPLYRDFQILPDPVEIQSQRRSPPDQDIVVSGLEMYATAQPDRLAQPAPDAITLDCIADLFGYRKADPNPTLVLAFAGLQDKGGGRNLDARRSGQKIRPLPQTFH